MINQEFTPRGLNEHAGIFLMDSFPARIGGDRTFDCWHVNEKLWITMHANISDILFTANDTWAKSAFSHWKNSEPGPVMEKSNG